MLAVKQKNQYQSVTKRTLSGIRELNTTCNGARRTNYSSPAVVKLKAHDVILR